MDAPFREGGTRSAVLELQSAEQIPWALDQLSELQPQGVVLFLEPAIAGALVTQAVERGHAATYLGDERLDSRAFNQAAGAAAWLNAMLSRKLPSGDSLDVISRGASRMCLRFQSRRR